MRTAFPFITRTLWINRNFLRATIYGEPMSAADLTSYWTGNAVQVYYPPESDTGDENG